MAQDFGGAGKKGERVDGVKIVPFPMVIVNPTMGSGGGLTLLGFYTLTKKDTVSPSSVAMVLGGYTSTKSYFGMAGNMFYLAEDTWRLAVFGGRILINHDFDYDVNGDKVNLKYGDNYWLVALSANYSFWERLFGLIIVMS